MRPAAYEQLSQPESEIVMLISEMLALLGSNSRGGLSDQTAMMLMSVTITNDNVFTY
jgi:hypothetical protein